MTAEEMERAIEFLLDHHSKVSTDIERHSEQITQLTADIRALTQVAASTQNQLDSVISEMRDGFNQLIVGNEVTRDLANKVASLEVQTSQRVTSIERRLDDTEKQ